MTRLISNTTKIKHLVKYVVVLKEEFLIAKKGRILINYCVEDVGLIIREELLKPHYFNRFFQWHFKIDFLIIIRTNQYKKGFNELCSIYFCNFNFNYTVDCI